MSMAKQQSLLRNLLLPFWPHTTALYLLQPPAFQKVDLSKEP